MSNFNFKQYRFVGILVVIFLVFIVVISTAFSYLPSNSVTVLENKEVQQIETLDDSEKNEEYIESERKDEDDISEAKQEENYYNGLMEYAISKRKEGKYIPAEKLFKKALSYAETVDERAKCYDEIVITNALQGNYDIAIQHAELVIDIAPSLEREIMLARLYNKTGNAEKASSIINKILDKSFDN